MVRKLCDDIAQQIVLYRDGRVTTAQLVLAIERLIGDDSEYVTLDSTLSAGRHEEESGVDLGREY